MGKFEELKESGVFGHLSDGELGKVVKIAQEKKYRKGDIVIAENMAGMALYLIDKGTVEIVKSMGLEKEKVLATLTAGDCFGEIALFDEAPHSAVVRTRDACSLLVIPKKDFDRLINEEKALGLKILKQLLKIVAFRLRQTDEQVVNTLCWTLSGQQMK